MSRRSYLARVPRMVGLGALAGAPLSALLFVSSCADEGTSATLGDDGGFVVPEHDAAEATSADADAGVDASCEAGDIGCTTEDTPCDRTEWCPYKTGADGRYALTSIWGSGRNDVWAVGAAGSVIHWNGTDWQNLSVGSTYTLFGVGGSSGTDVWAVSTPSVVYHGGLASDGGAAWTAMPALSPNYSYDPLPALTSVWATSADDVWIGGGDKINFPVAVKLWHKIPDPDGGVAWEPIGTCQYNDCAVIRGIWSSGPNDVWAVGDRGKTYHTTNVSPDGVEPTVFTQVESQSSARLRGVWGTGAANVWAVGERGTIRHRGAGNGPWEIVASPSQEELRAVWGSSADDVWAVGDSGTILHYDGAGWTLSTVTLPLGPKPNLYGIWGSSKDDVWIVGEGIVLRFSGHRPTNAESRP